MTFFAELSSVRAIKARVTLPTFGAFHADVTVDHEVAYTTSQKLVLTIGDLKLACSPWRDALGYGGRTTVRLVGGFGGWRMLLKEKSYRASAGVRLSMVLGDAAREVGEKIVIGVDRALGPHYVRENDQPAGRHLNANVPGAWWIDPDGTTRTGVRPVVDIVSKFSVTAFDGARGLVVVATETPADFVPGRRFKTAAPNTTFRIAGVTHLVSEGSVRTEVLAA